MISDEKVPGYAPAVEVTQNNGQVECEVPQTWQGEYFLTTSTRVAIDEVLVVLRRLGYCDEDVFAVHLAIDEAVTNSIKHGNGYDPRKIVHLQYKVTPLSAMLIIEDQGQGFNPHTVPDPTLPENLEKPNGRGLLIMRRYMSTVRFNKLGNRVTLCKRRTRSNGIIESKI